MTDFSMPVELALFPLRTVLFPQGYLPLQIFEVRYLDMVGKCFKAGAPFGVVTLEQGDEVRPAPGELGTREGSEQIVFHAVGTLAQITHLSRPRPGLLLIQCLGQQRFRLQQRSLLPSGLWVGEVQPLAPDASAPVPPDLQPVARALQRVVQRLTEQETPAAEMPMQPPYRFDDCTWVANRWCELLPMTLPERHRLMTLDNALIRLELVSDLLEQHGIPL